MKCVLIGGSGFVGSKLIAELTPNSCHNIDKNPSTLFNAITTIGDIRFPEQIQFDKQTKAVVLLRKSIEMTYLQQLYIMKLM